jgi:hypothetical protein
VPNPGDKFPTERSYRGVLLHAFQPDSRVEGFLMPAIDVVHSMCDIERLYAYAVDFQHPPEARLYARAKCEAFF